MSETSDRAWSRRQFLAGAGAATAAGLTGCGAAGSPSSPQSSPPPVGSSPPDAAAAAGTVAAAAGTDATAATTATTATTAPSGQPAGPGLVPGGPAAAVTHGRRDRPRVALTFHLGPHAAGQDVRLAQRLLDTAAQRSVPITVFAVGRWLDEHRDLVPVILAGRNEIANHTYTHPTLTALPARQVAAEIVGCRDVLLRLTPTQGRYFRPSGTSTATPLILAEAGAAGYRTVVDFDVDPLDYQSPGTDAVVGRVRAGARPGSIVSMHFGYPGTIAAFPRIVANLRTAGLSPVTVHEILT